MPTLATLVLHAKNGQPSIGYRTETLSQIACGDLAEGTQAAWEMRCWTPGGARLGHGVKAVELVALVGATFRVINHCFGDGTLREAVRRFNCAANGIVTEIPNKQALDDHLMIWSNQAAQNDVFLQTREVGIAQIQAIGQQLQRAIEKVAEVRDEVLGPSATPTPISWV
ncbi:hypothetical protein [Luteimonas sp. YGD11-2]|uniref:hypothetical protein n=1 Tax=Luteimonas sp. YGD11-2 TaxID=2508168 RepID=UPI00100AF219|nr:hypothetical protein [Luteimonas sp. YGD11-2]